MLKGAGLAGLGFASAGLLAGRLGMIDKITAAIPGLKPASVHAQSVDDADILNFALNLEYLEAEFYTVATTGKTIREIGIGVNGVGNSGPTTGGARVALELGSVFPQRLHNVALEIAYDEQQHVKLLRSALGSYAVAKPAINLDALGIGFANFRQFLKLSRAFEDTGVSAYAGAAPLISSKAYLGVAAQILATEAYHSGNVRLMISENDVETTKTDSEDVLPPPSGKTVFHHRLERLGFDAYNRSGLGDRLREQHNRHNRRRLFPRRRQWLDQHRFIVANRHSNGKADRGVCPCRLLRLGRGAVEHTNPFIRRRRRFHV